MINKRVLTPIEKNLILKSRSKIDLSLHDPNTPIEYIVKTAEFRNKLFYVNENTLIPRIETEKIVDLALENIKTNFSTNKKVSILDLCTGSGCIGISLALELINLKQSFKIVLTDISSKAIKVAKKNTTKFIPNNLNNIDFRVSNLFQNIPNQKFDLIISNPPYVPTSRIRKLPKSVKNFEPLLALEGGPDGTTIINQIINALPEYQNNINAIIEIDDSHNISKIKSEGLKPSLIKDCFGINRFLSLTSL